jgi:hypothetical protein
MARIAAPAVRLAASVLACACAAAPRPDPADGETLARRYCASCHAYTPPAALTKDGWRPGLLHMAARLGLAEDLLRQPPAGFTAADEERVRYHLGKLRELDPPLLPSGPLVPREDFLAIWRYLVDHAPEQPLPQPAKIPVAFGPTPFVLGPHVPFHPRVHVAVSLVRIDAARRWLFFGGVKDWDPRTETNPAYLALLDAHGRLLQEIGLASAPVSLERTGDGYLLTLIGSLATVQSSEARLLRLSAGADGLRTSAIADGLVRAAGSAVHEREDGSRLIAVNGFGYYEGELSLLVEREGRLLSRRTLLDEPGAMLSRFGDFTRDGRLDLLCLFSQHRESLVLFADDGLGGYEPVELMRHHPAWGLSSFDLADMDGDGRDDLVVSNGDNGDYPGAPLKGYHGVRVYLDVGSAPGTPRYEERFFQPIHGAYKVLARDFDLDGDTDLAVIARYVDASAAPLENFVFLENRTARTDRRLRFRAATLAELESSAFLTMDAGDLDGDGDADLALGGGEAPLGFQHPGTDGAFGLVVLLNRTLPPAAATGAKP